MKLRDVEGIYVGNMENACLMFPAVTRDIRLFTSGLDIMNEQGKETSASFLELAMGIARLLELLREPMNSDSKNDFSMIRIHDRYVACSEDCMTWKDPRVVPMLWELSQSVERVPGGDYGTVKQACKASDAN